MNEARKTLGGYHAESAFTWARSLDHYRDVAKDKRENYMRRCRADRRAAEIENYIIDRADSVIRLLAH